ncbi:MAG: universal stress protein [Solirubrobacterales bacterium]
MRIDPEGALDRKIVIAYDGSPNSEDALALGAKLCDLFEASPVVVCCVTFPNHLLDPLDLGLGLEEITEPIFRKARSALPGRRVETRKLIDKSPARALHNLVEETVPLAMVIGSAHAGSFRRVHLGQVGRQLLNGAECPIAVAPRGYSTERAGQISRICAAVDEGQESDTALSAASAIAQRAGASIKIASVLEFPMVNVGPLPGTAISDLDQLQTSYTAQILDNALARVPDGISTESEGYVGDPGQRLSEIAEDFDLMVIGSRCYGPVKRVLLGSVSAHLMDHARCPLLIMPRCGFGQPAGPAPVTRRSVEAA